MLLRRLRQLKEVYSTANDTTGDTSTLATITLSPNTTDSSTITKTTTTSIMSSSSAESTTTIVVNPSIAT
jgi:hypothetical protein